MLEFFSWGKFDNRKIFEFPTSLPQRASEVSPYMGRKAKIFRVYYIQNIHLEHTFRITFRTHIRITFINYIYNLQFTFYRLKCQCSTYCVLLSILLTFRTHIIITFINYIYNYIITHTTHITYIYILFTPIITLRNSIPTYIFPFPAPLHEFSIRITFINYTYALPFPPHSLPTRHSFYLHLELHL